MWRTTVRGLLAHKLRFALTALAVFLGVAFMAGTLVLTDTIGKAFDELFASVNDGVDAVVREESPFDDDFGQAIRSPIPEQIADELTAVDGVESVEGNVFGAATIIGTPEQIAKREKEGDDALGRNRGAQSPALGFNWPVAQEVNPLRVVDGKAPVADDEIVVDKATADEEDLAVGDDVVVTTVAGTEPYALVGIVTFGTADSPGGSSVTAWATPAAQRALGFDGTYLDVRVIADDGVSQDEVVANISEAIDAGEITGTANDRDLKLEVLTGDELTEEDQNEIADQLGFFNTFLLVFAGVALFVGIFIIYNTFSIIVAQRTREMALSARDRGRPTASADVGDGGGADRRAARLRARSRRGNPSGGSSEGCARSVGYRPPVNQHRDRHEDRGRVHGRRDADHRGFRVDAHAKGRGCPTDRRTA